MLIKTELTATSKIVHNGTEYPVVGGYADVPQDVADYFTDFSEWMPVTDPLDKKVQAALEKAKPTDQGEQAAGNEQASGAATPTNDGTNGAATPPTTV